MQPLWAASNGFGSSGRSIFLIAFVLHRLDRLTQAAKELSETTGQRCLPYQADVRQSKTLQEAAAKTIETFGRIDFVICGNYLWAVF
jgi:NADP-dependent 3-hydroxy acid dehydrogenase YdfG